MKRDVLRLLYIETTQYLSPLTLYSHQITLPESKMFKTTL